MPLATLQLSKARLQQYAPLLRHLPPATSLLLVILVAASAARIVWLLYPVPEPAPVTPPPAAGPGPAARLDVERIIAAQPFGLAQAPAAPDAAVHAPETSLNLKLKGIFASARDGESRALIADDSGREKPYAVGDDIPGGATLNAIHADRVILERSGRFETLRLERNKTGAASGQDLAQPLAGPAPGGPASSLAELRSELLREPGKAAQYVRLQPVYAEGKLQGYRVYPGPNRELFQQAGLRAGELVTSVNGVQLDDAAKALQLLGDLREVQQLTLTLERAGQSRTVNLSLTQ